MADQPVPAEALLTDLALEHAIGYEIDNDPLRRARRTADAASRHAWNAAHDDPLLVDVLVAARAYLEFNPASVGMPHVESSAGQDARIQLYHALRAYEEVHGKRD